MVSASALAKRPDRLIAAAVATDFLSSERRVVVMAFSLTSPLLRPVFLLGLQYLENRLESQRRLQAMAARTYYREDFSGSHWLAPERAKQRRYLPVSTPMRIGSPLARAFE